MSTTPQKANLIQSMALGGCSACFAVNFTHREYIAVKWNGMPRLILVVEKFSAVLYLRSHSFLSNCILSISVIRSHLLLKKSAIETVKTRMQVSGLGVGHTASSLYANEGVAAFWKGLGFGWGREIFYTSIKLGGE